MKLFCVFLFIVFPAFIFAQVNDMRVLLSKTNLTGLASGICWEIIDFKPSRSTAAHLYAQVRFPLYV
jgi:hypothetical protein